MLQPSSRIKEQPVMNRARPDEVLIDGVSVVVPVYDSEDSLPELVARLEPVLSALELPFEAIFVNDGSRDRSWDVISQLAASQHWVRGFALMRNYGQHNALLCGIRAARYSVVVTMDDDLQHPPEEIPKLLAALARGLDVVYGAPRKMAHSVSRNILSQITKLLLARTMGLRSIRDISAFRAFRTRTRCAFADFRSPNPMIDVLLSWGTSRFGAVQVSHEPRHKGKSTYTVASLVNQALLLLTGFSTAPLRFASFLGFGVMLFGVVVFGYVLARYLLGGTLPGFSFLASLIIIFGGVQLFTLGIIGEYLARIFNRTMERPGYLIAGITTPCAKPAAIGGNGSDGASGD
jgi:glycosyltransferase involved in cell wall biosynthesis